MAIFAESISQKIIRLRQGYGGRRRNRARFYARLVTPQFAKVSGV